MIPFKDNVPRLGPPIAVTAIIAANVLVFLLQLGLDQYGQFRTMHLFGVVPLRIFHPELAKQMGYPAMSVIPFFTYMFLHGGWLHIILNMWMLWIFGDNIEDVTGHGGFVVFYVLCGLAALGLHVLAEPNSTAPVVGASGAIGGVMGAYMLLYPHGRVLTFIPLFFIPLIVRIPAVLFLGLWFASQFFSGVLAKAGGAGGGGVAWWAHIGGFAAGLILIKLFQRRGACRYCYNHRSREYERLE
jgi:membrane associated rhomboid family serine protease